jgi:hypothetical protein
MMISEFEEWLRSMFALYPQACPCQPQNRTIWRVAHTTGPYGGRK